MTPEANLQGHLLLILRLYAETWASQDIHDLRFVPQ
jgi:hypothetical protein